MSLAGFNHIRTTPPPSPIIGEIYFDIVTHKLKVYCGTGWIDVNTDSYKIIEKVADNQFSCVTKSANIMIDKMISDFGFKSFIKSRQLDKILYVIQDEGELAAFLCYMSDAIMI